MPDYVNICRGICQNFGKKCPVRLRVPGLGLEEEIDAGNKGTAAKLCGFLVPAEHCAGKAYCFAVFGVIEVG